MSYTINGYYDPKRKPGPDLERLVGFDEAWVLCSRTPKPGWRFLGRFFAKDVLVLLSAVDKHSLANKESVTREVGIMLTKWVDILGSNVHRGSEFGEYYSGVPLNVEKTL